MNIKKMKLKIIKTEKEYQKALNRVDELFDLKPKKNSVFGNELEILLLLIKNYEDAHYAIHEQLLTLYRQAEEPGRERQPACKHHQIPQHIACKISFHTSISYLSRMRPCALAMAHGQRYGRDPRIS